MATWAAIGAAVSFAIGVIDPPIIGSGEGPAEMAMMLGSAGAGPGVLFAVLLLVAHRRSEVAGVRFHHAVMWGVAAAAVLALLSDGALITPRLWKQNVGLVVNSCVLGGISGIVSVALARLTRRREPAVI
jgi:hypothetical protein